MCVNYKHIEYGLDHKSFWVTTVKYFSKHRKNWYELVDELKIRPNSIFIDKELTTKVIMDCRTIAEQKVRTKLRFKQYDVILS